MSVGADSRWNRSVVIVLRDQFGTLQRAPGLDLLPRYTAIQQPTNRRYRLKAGDDWHLLGFRALGNAAHWWALGEYNQVVDPFEFFEDGKTLFIPSLSDFQFNVLDFEEVDIEEGET